jgi:pyruvate dehydrogenase E2 component (dihydrolipoamide acetyltransferase)
MEFRLPDIGEGVAEGEILKWMVREGDKVKEDQPLVEVMTDKVNVQIPSPRSGTVSKILAKEGESVKVGQTIMIITEEGEQVTSTPESEYVEEPAKQVSQPQPRQSAQQPEQVQPGGGASTMVLATPVTRRVARELGVDLTQVSGTGPHGRVTEEDVRKAAEVRIPTVGVRPTPTAAKAGPNEEVIPLRGVRKLIAERMIKSQSTAAHVTHVDEAEMTEVVLLREAFKASAEKRGVRLTFLPFIIKAVIPALKEYPFVNSSVDEQGVSIILKKYYNIGIATDTEQGLTVPVLKDADRKDVFELGGEIEKLADRARAGQLVLEEVRGSTFTITNVGAIGGLFATPIINPPEVAILGTHKVQKRPVVRDGKIDIRDMMNLSLTFDHRVIDGAYAARFLTKIIDTIQDPKKLLSEVL